MDDTSPQQSYKINAMHGHDVGVWLCEGSGLFLSPCLFMQAMCPHPVPRSLLIKPKQTTTLSKAFRKSGALPLTYSECGRVPPWPYHLHLFAAQVPIVRAFEQESELQGWSFTVPLIGIIVIFDQRYDRPPAALSLNRLLNRSPAPQLETNKSLDWARNQNLPYVVAALGYDDSPASLAQFRGRHGLAADIPVVLGPALANARREETQSGGMFSSMFEHQKLVLDQEYARTVLGALYQLIERKRLARPAVP